MAKYIVKQRQNLYDIALQLYGSIEGIFDLLISNDKIGMTVDLRAGTELNYHEGFAVNAGVVQVINEQQYMPANGERHVYFKGVNEPLMLIVAVYKDLDHVTFKAGGEGDMIIDWGDNSDLETLHLSHKVVTYEHYFDNISDSRRIKVYGTFKLTVFDTSYIGGNMYLMRPLTVDEYISRANRFKIQALLLCEGTYKVDLQFCSISDLSPIYDMSLQELDLRYVLFSSVSVLDDYLVHLVEHYGTRRDCTVYLSTEPSERGMQAIKTIINNPDWNVTGKWKFVINDQTYTT